MRLRVTSLRNFPLLILNRAIGQAANSWPSFCFRFICTADLDFIPDAGSSYLSGIRGQDASPTMLTASAFRYLSRGCERYNAGPIPSDPSSGTQEQDASRYNAGSIPSISTSGTRERDASRYNAGSNPHSPTSDTHGQDAGCEAVGPNSPSASSGTCTGLFAAFAGRWAQKEEPIIVP